jgi:hypothetical protein
MKREILCPECAKKIKDLINMYFTGPDMYVCVRSSHGLREHVVLKWGRAAGRYHCDQCNKTLNGLDHCAALTIHTGDYYEWEQGYILLKGD